MVGMGLELVGLGSLADLIPFPFDSCRTDDGDDAPLSMRRSLLPNDQTNQPKTFTWRCSLILGPRNQDPTQDRSVASFFTQ